jgi:hypothetical protein
MLFVATEVRRARDNADWRGSLVALGGDGDFEGDVTVIDRLAGTLLGDPAGVVGEDWCCSISVSSSVCDCGIKRREREIRTFDITASSHVECLVDEW